MYFSDLSDDELKYFHHTLNASFSIGLTDILTSDLFHCEQIQSTLYRIYPLFYTENIISSNPSDKILDNQCLIVEVQDHETYYSFSKTNDTHNIVIDESCLELYGIGDTLSTDNFNALVYRLRQRETLSGVLDIEETSTTGLYGTYTIIGGTGRVKNHQGYIINNDLKEHPLTIKLTNPYFKDANYRVTLTVKSITGVNVYEESSTEHITKTPLTVYLSEGVESMIDVTEYSNDTVLLFDATVDVLFDNPEITNSSYNLTLTTNHDSINYGETVTLTSTLTSTSGVTGYSVLFYEGDTLLDTKTTNSSGVATLTITPTMGGTHIYKVVCLGLNSTVNVSVVKLVTTLTVTSTKTKYHPTEAGTYTVTLKDINGNPVSGAMVYIASSDIDVETTDANGQIIKNIPSTTTLIDAVFRGDNNYYGHHGSLNIIVEKEPVNLTLTSNKSTIDHGSITLSGTLKGTWEDTPLPNKTVTLLNTHNEVISTVTTNNNGEYSYTYTPPTTGTNNIYATFSGDDYELNTQMITIIVRKSTQITDVQFSRDSGTTNYTLTGKLSTTEGELLTNTQIEAKFVYLAVHNPPTYYIITEATATTNSQGVFSITTTYEIAHDSDAIRIMFNGDTYHAKCGYVLEIGVD